VNIALLQVLQERPDSYFWPDSLARSLSIPPARLLRDLGELEEFGFGIEQVPNRGIRFTEPARRLCVDQIEWGLGTQIIGRRIAVWKRVTSTNDLAARAGKSRSNDGFVVLAEEQTAGRGRRHRRWHAPPQSSILMSVLLFPPAAVRSVTLLTSLAAVAVADLVNESLALPARIKWPNDVRVDRKKFCGILVENLVCGRRQRTTGNADRRAHTSRATVIGIGVNVNIEPDQFPTQLANPATSLQNLCGRRLDRSDFARSLIQRLDVYYRLALTGKTSTIWKKWQEFADSLNCLVRIELAKRELVGRLVEISPPDELAIHAAGQLVRLPLKETLSIDDFNSVADQKA
jgi:BirA family biotin operon repressor/biotin-[acetyl-CoA-carboxylase] ligase